LSPGWPNQPGGNARELPHNINRPQGHKKESQKHMRNIIAELETKIAADCTPVDREAAFNDMLDECYSFADVGGPFAHMLPSRVLLECDPVAHRCGVNDYADGMEWVEVGSETYQQDDVEAAKQELIDELESELVGIEDDEDEAAQADELRGLIAQLEKHSF
jgi:hypothetical protein